MSLRKDEDHVALAVYDPNPLELVRAMAGWVVKSGLSEDQVAQAPEAHKALMGQAADRKAALMFDARTVDGETIHQCYERERGPLVDLILELVATFLDRDMFKVLVASLPEELTR